jgi:hypothetical protein
MAMASTFRLDDQTKVYIEADDDVRARRGVELVARDDKGAIDFTAAAEKALPAARVLVDQLEQLVDNVREIEVEFGLKFSGEVGALIAKTGTEANFRIKLVWNPSPE